MRGQQNIQQAEKKAAIFPPDEQNQKHLWLMLSQKALQNIANARYASCLQIIDGDVATPLDCNIAQPILANRQEHRTTNALALQSPEPFPRDLRHFLRCLPCFPTPIIPCGSDKESVFFTRLRQK